MLHKILLMAAIIAAIILDIKNISSAKNEFQNGAQENGFSILASSELLGANVRHSKLNTTIYGAN